MRTTLLLMLAVLSGALAGVLWRLLGVEWLKADPFLVAVVFVTLVAKSSPAGSLLAVFVLGLVADALGASPPGTMVLVYLACWWLLARLRNLLSPGSWPGRLVLMAALALLCQLLLFAPLLLMRASAPLLTLQAKALLPVALLTAAWSMLWWPLYGKLWQAAERLGT